MKLPSFKRIFKTDYKPNIQATIEQLARSINDGMDNLFNMSNKNVSLDDNLYCIVKTITVTVDSTGTPKQTVGFKNTLSSKIKGLQVINAQNSTDSSIYVNNCPFISFSESSSFININNITGLPANNKFDLTIIAWG
jgi:cell division protein ZapA (FtsZ GTPase activity inhibitor)